MHPWIERRAAHPRCSIYNEFKPGCSRPAPATGHRLERGQPRYCRHPRGPQRQCRSGVIPVHALWGWERGRASARQRALAADDRRRRRRGRGQPPVTRAPSFTPASPSSTTWATSCSTASTILPAGRWAGCCSSSSTDAWRNRMAHLRRRGWMARVKPSPASGLSRHGRQGDRVVE